MFRLAGNLLPAAREQVSASLWVTATPRRRHPRQLVSARSDCATDGLADKTQRLGISHRSGN